MTMQCQTTAIFLLRSFLMVIVASVSLSANATSWSLDKVNSGLHFLSVKKDTIPEVQSFDRIDARIEGYQAKLVIDTASINTGNETRDSRIQTWVLKTGMLPNILFSLELAPSLVDEFPVGATRKETLQGTLELGGLRNQVEVRVHISRPTLDQIVVNNLRPVVVDINDYDLNDGFEVMRTIAGLSVITQRMPVFFNLLFERDDSSIRSDSMLVVGDIPAAPQAPIAMVSGSLINVAWNSMAEEADYHVVSVKTPNGDWQVVDKVAADESTFLYQAEEQGEFAVRVQTVANGRISDASAEILAVVGSVQSGSNELNNPLADLDLDSFNAEINQSLIQTTCVACHAVGKIAEATGLNFVQGNDLESAEYNAAELFNFGDNQRILDKISATITHYGSTVFTFSANSSEYERISNFLNGEVYFNAEANTLVNTDLDGDGVVNFLDFYPMDASLVADQGYLYERWNVSAGSTANLVAGSIVGQDSDVKEIHTGALQTGSNLGDNFTTRIRTYLVPSVSGDYHFYGNADDGVVVYLSNDANPGDKQVILDVNKWQAKGQFTKYAAQKSSLVSLEADKAYYLEVLAYEGGGGDHVGVAWSRMMNGQEGEVAIIPAANLQQFYIPEGFAEEDVAELTPPSMSDMPVMPEQGDMLGEELYAAQCAVCHGADGNSTNPILGALNRPDLTSYVTNFMPFGSPGQCDADCATKIVSWMTTAWADFEAPAEPVEVPEVETPDYEIPAEVVDQEIAAVGQAIYQNQCATCHGVDGQGNTPLTSALLRADLTHYIADTMPYGAPGRCDAQCAEYVAYYMIQAWGGEGDQPITEVPNVTVSESLAAVQNTKAFELLNKLSLNLADRKPNAIEIQSLAAQGASALEAIVDGQLESEAFISRIKNIFNDLILTDGKMKDGYHSVVRNYSWNSFDNADSEWVKDYRPQVGSGLTSSQYIRLRQYTSSGHVKAPVELVAHVVKNNRPFSEILTADYAMLNWYTAKSYGLENAAQFNDMSPEDVYVPGFTKDPNHYVPVNLPKVPSAGVLTTAVYMNRYPTTDSNLNRHRAYTLFKQFLDTDILAIGGERPGDSDSAHENPTLTDPGCVGCHQVMDPVASAFKNWISFAGEARPYYKENPSTKDWDPSVILPLGFNGETAPENSEGLPWLVEKVVADKRFARAMVKAMFSQITGAALVPNTTDGVNFQSEAYLNQQAYIAVIADLFQAENYDFKAMVKRLALGKYATGLNDSDMERLLITPSQLNKKIAATLGEGWGNWLSTWNTLYGGINSNNVIMRNQSSSGASATIQLRMAEDMACEVTAKNFAKLPEDRMILKGVEPNILPDSTENIVLIKQSIVDLYADVLGLNLSTNSQTVTIAYEVYTEALSIGQAGIASQSIPTRIASACRVSKNSAVTNKDYIYDDVNYYTRAWQAVVQFVLMDPRYFYL